MASSSTHLHFLPLLLLSAAVLLPFISCGDDNDLTVSLCEKVVKKNQSNPTYADKMTSDLSKLAPLNGFAYAYHDPGIYGLAWCRGDFSGENCSACLTEAAKKLADICSHEAIAARLVFKDFCYLRLDIEDFMGKLDLFGRILYQNTTANRKIDEGLQMAYWASVEGLLNELKEAIPQHNKRFGRMKVDFDREKLKIYGMGQCVMGLSEKLCRSCLDQAMKYMMGNCMHGRKCEIFYGSCFLKYYTKRKILS